MPATDSEKSGRLALADAFRGWKSTSSRMPALLGIDDRLLEATIGSDAPPEDTAVDWTSVIKACDRIYCVSAGVADETPPCQPLWYTKLETLPELFTWSGEEASCWTFHLRLPSKEIRRTASGLPNRFVLPLEWQRDILPGDRWRWSVHRDGVEKAFVRGVFELVRPDTALVTEGVPEAAPFPRSPQFQLMGAAIEADLFQRAYLIGTALPLNSMTAVERFVAHRLMALMYRQMATRLSGPPLWMGEPEGLAAGSLSRHHLACAWTSLGMPVDF